ncbi:hypothetical protein A1O3_07147 [Capronia epimyces CBS 606.96]|uniref:Uncharacterized protein n=1 Tax=Capronia epimyces CBS 606.96 TaxID=1182542 RepID=W9XV64_9EURO|nr:uncharacterized protein A1O3_07147 [Capronia epimyces CBS 606.96]EXJ80861.1 hypothetical protein A1O3_07147 [Capronia epimyces CBS 606.96]
MRAALSKSPENKWAHVDINYSSPIWEERVEASEVFIIPTVFSGQGTRLLLSIAEQGIADLANIASELKRNATATAESLNIVRSHWLQQLAKMRSVLGLDFDEEETRAYAHQMFLPYELKAIQCKQTCDLAEHIVDRFVQLQKLARSVLAKQEEKGQQITKTPEGVKKLTIGIKCIDSVWLDITRSWFRLSRALEQIRGAEMMLAETDQHEESAEELEAAHVLDEITSTMEADDESEGDDGTTMPEQVHHSLEGGESATSATPSPTPSGDKISFAKAFEIMNINAVGIEEKEALVATADNIEAGGNAAGQARDSDEPNGKQDSDAGIISS